MGFRARSLLRVLGGVCAVVLASTVLAGVPATADTRPTVPGEPVTVSADPLPTVQVDGVVWQQVVVGDTVYAAGSFASARPAGAAPGTQTTARANLLAFDVRTGALISSFAPRTNAQVLAIAASPDGSRLYIGGDFTQVNGVTANRIAAISTSTGALVTSFRTGTDARVRAIAATADTVYFGGLFNAVGATSRTRLAAVRASDGGLLGWAPRAAGASGVWAIAVPPDRSRVVVGGSFTTLNGSSTPGYGLGAVHPTTGANQPFATNSVVRTAGSNAAITSLSGDGELVYGTAYTFGSGGNFEGTFAATWAGDLRWLEDCHGDTYAAWPVGDVVYQASHKHYCGNIGGFPQTNPWGFQRATAVTRAVTGTATRDQWGYASFEGRPTPSMLNWYPAIDNGTYTGQNQGPWTVTGTAEYVVMGGEFRTVNGTPQQGLVRFAVPRTAPNDSGPVVRGGAFDLSGSSPSSGTVRLQWRANHDRDNRDLTYHLTRNSQPLATLQARSTFFQRPPMGYLDKGLPVGSTQRYRLRAVDPWGNEAWSDSIHVTVSGTTPPLGPYASTVLADSPASYWRLGEPAGTRALDRAGFNDMNVASGVLRGTAGAVTGDPDTATTFDGTSAGYAVSRTDGRPGDAFSIEAWFRTTTTRGGKIVGLGDAPSGTSTLVDRHLYMENGGRIRFGVRPGDRLTVVSPASYNDGRWHHVVATLGSGGMALYVDGAAVAGDSSVRAAAPAQGYWRVGGDTLSGWPSRPTSDWFGGAIDEVAVYARTLGPADVARHWAARAGTSPQPPAENLAPTASFTAVAQDRTAQLDGSASSDADGSVVSHTWDLGDGTAASGRTASHTYAAAGTYTVRLTVTDDRGATGTTTRSVSVSDPAPDPQPDPEPGVLAADAFSRDVTGGWGAADTGGPWSPVGSSSRFSVTAGSGRITIPTAGGGASTYLTGVTSTSTDLASTVWLDRLPDAGAAYPSVTGRRVGSDDYRAKLAITSSGAVTAALTRVVGGRETTLSTGTVAGLQVAPGSRLRVRLQVTGTSPTTLRLKVWPDGQVEPAAWLRAATDTTAGLQAGGGVGLVTYVSSSATNVPIGFGFDDVRAVPAP